MNAFLKRFGRFLYDLIFIGILTLPFRLIILLLAAIYCPVSCGLSGTSFKTYWSLILEGLTDAYRYRGMWIKGVKYENFSTYYDEEEEDE